MFTVKIVSHLMPWEIDYALLSFIKFKKSFERVPKDIKIQFDCVLNVSDSLIDWNQSRLPKDFFIEKFNQMKYLVECFDVTRYDIVDYSDRIYGHLDLQKDSVSEDVDGYLYFCTDRNVDDTTLPYICMAAKEISDKYFVLSSEIYRGWDSSWDVISSKKYFHIDHSVWSEECPFKVEVENELNEVSIEKISTMKFAGWFDYFSRDFVNKLVVVPDDWYGYGPWDLYAMICATALQNENPSLNISQYVLRGKMNHALEIVRNPNGFAGYYKNFILSEGNVDTELMKTKQREMIQSTISDNVKKVISDYKTGKLIL